MSDRKKWIAMKLNERDDVLAEWIANPKRVGKSLQYPIWIDEGHFVVKVELA